MKLIRVTTKDTQCVWINPAHIGHLYVEESYVEHGIHHPTVTRVGVTTHYNGGWRVRETPEQIIELINKTEEGNK